MINVENVSKRFCRNLKRALRYGILDFTKELAGQSQEARGLRPGEFWALQDVSFQVRRGESMGLIGHNGAGKSTLLKLINGLIKPTRGRITVKGSVRALLALGAGFNPVLTGRENVRIAGAVLGYSDREINEHFEEIIAFSEIGEFIDSSVQSYSTGMVARLGFSVAVHTRPDILLVDEVLAVGDLNFAIKCYRKISDFRSHGGSMLLVSHNPYAIRTNCDRAIWIEHGMIQKMGTANEVCEAYELFVARQDVTLGEERCLDDAIEILDVNYPPAIQSGDKFVLEFRLRAARKIEEPIVGISFFNVMGQNVLSNVSSVDGAESSISIDSTVATIRVKYDYLLLSRGVYYISLVLAEKYLNNQLAALVNCYRLEVMTTPDDYGAGMFKLRPVWEIEK